MATAREISKILAACCLMGTGGCASMFTTGIDSVPVSTKPPGATVRLDGFLMGRTPLIVEVRRRHSEGVFTFELPGYETKTVDRDRVFNGMVLLNLGWFPIPPIVGIGALIDLAAGNAGKYSVEPLRVELTPLPPPKDSDD